MTQQVPEPAAMLHEARLTTVELTDAVATMRAAGVHANDLDTITDEDVSAEAAAIADRALEAAFADNPRPRRQAAS